MTFVNTRYLLPEPEPGKVITGPIRTMPGSKVVGVMPGGNLLGLTTRAALIVLQPEDEDDTGKMTEVHQIYVVNGSANVDVLGGELYFIGASWPMSVFGARSEY